MELTACTLALLSGGNSLRPHGNSELRKALLHEPSAPKVARKVCEGKAKCTKTSRPVGSTCCKR
eukprot:4647471-Amphidinium_carterae.1